MQYPVIDPVIFSLGPVAVRWYGLSYLAGFVVVWWLGRVRAKTDPGGWTDTHISDLVFYGAMGAVVGGRLGYVFMYNFGTFVDDPLYLFQLWKGGMSFHGGLMGVAVALILFARKTGRSFISVADFVAPLCPIGLGFGRLANFINMELPGRVTDSAFGLIYQCKAVQGLNKLCVSEWESVARHPSPLYQAFTEGLLLFLLLWFASKSPRPAGFVSGLFLIGYGVMRITTEFFREPDAHIGFVFLDSVTMGQILSIPMIIAGILFVAFFPGLNKKVNT